MTLRLLWRRLRGLVGTAITWALGWAGVGLAVGAGFWLSGATLFGPVGSRWLVVWAWVGAVSGAISGAVFSLVVMALDRRRDVTLTNPLWFGALGAVAGGVVTAMLFEASMLFGVIGAAIGFSCGGGSVAIARRALPAPGASATSLPPAA